MKLILLGEINLVLIMWIIATLVYLSIAFIVVGVLFPRKERIPRHNYAGAVACGLLFVCMFITLDKIVEKINDNVLADYSVITENYEVVEKEETKYEYYINDGNSTKIRYGKKLVEVPNRDVKVEKNGEKIGEIKKEVYQLKEKVLLGRKEVTKYVIYDK